MSSRIQKEREKEKVGWCGVFEWGALTLEDRERERERERGEFVELS